MEPRPLHYIARACSGVLSRGSSDTLIHRVSTDSRQIQPGDLFFALSGPRFDGHAFLSEAARKQAAGVVVAAPHAADMHLPCAVLSVDDPRRALGRLAAAYRAEFNLPIVAVAGSNGKTTTKNFLAAVFRQQFRTLASPASFNNDVGVPLTLLELECQHQAAVLETGTNHPGELAPLLRMIRPQIGVMTGLGGEHLEFFEDLDGVAQEEGWLPELLPAHGRLFVNGDSEKLHLLENRSAAPIVRVGFGSDNPWRVAAASLSPAGTLFELDCPRAEFNGAYHIQLLGRHQARNASLAAAAGAELGLSPAQVRAGLAESPPAEMRLQLWEHHGVRMLDDAYNANVDSVQAALETCRDLPCAGRRVALLGTMAELGRQSGPAHWAVGRMAAEYGMDILVAIGPWRDQTIAAARAAGLNEIHGFETIPEAAAFVQMQTRPGDLVLLKASRAAGFERFKAIWSSPP